jgi:hypothetical protein
MRVKELIALLAKADPETFVVLDESELLVLVSDVEYILPYKQGSVIPKAVILRARLYSPKTVLGWTPIDPAARSSI